MDGQGHPEPRVVLPPQPLEVAERRQVRLAAISPVVIVALVLVPFALFWGATWSSVLGGALVYGGLLSLAAGFVMVDRLHNRQCPACRERNPRGSERCGGCDYDLVNRPRFACQQRHRIHLDPGLCACGLRLSEISHPGGIGNEIKVILKVGAWMLAFLMGMGVLFRLAGG